jgi:hypothetical protein
VVKRGHIVIMTQSGQVWSFRRRCLI